MTIPSVNVTVQDGRQGGQSFGDDVMIVCGCSDAGTHDVVSAQYSQWSDLVADYGYGIGIDAAALLLNAGIPVRFVKMTSTTAGTAGSVTHSGTGAAVLTVSGAPNDAYNVKVLVAIAGSTDTAPYPGIQVSLDGGLTYGPTVRLSSLGVYAPPHTGLTLTWSIVTNLTMVVGDTYSFACVAPIWGSSDLTSVMAAIQAQPQLAGHYRMIQIVGPASAANAGTVDTAVQAMYAANDFETVLMESVGFGSNTHSQWITALLADFVSFASADGRVAVGAGPVLIQSPITGAYMLRSVAWLAAREFGTATIGEDISAPSRGSLAGIVNIQGTTVVYHDENVLGGLDAARFITMRTLTGRSGYYITNPNTMAALGSDFALEQRVFQANVFAFTMRDFFLDALSVPVRVNTSNGHIIDQAARALETGANNRVDTALLNPGYISGPPAPSNAFNPKGGYTLVSRADNLLATDPTMHVQGKFVSLAYPKHISVVLSVVLSFPAQAA